MHPQRLFSRRREFPALTPEIETEARPVFIDPAEPLVDFGRYWRIIRKHRGVVIATVSAALLIVGGHIASTSPTYTAETTIMLRPAVAGGSDTLSNLVEMQTAVYTADQYYKTQSAILESPNIAADVIRHLELANRPAFTETGQAESGLTQLWRQLLGYISDFLSHKTRSSGAGNSPGSRAPQTDYDGMPAGLVHKYLAMLKVTLVPDTNLLKISFTTHDSALSAELANAHIEGYRRQQSEIQYHQSEDAQEFLRGKLVDIRDQLEKSEAALNDFRRRKGIIPGLISLDGKNTVVLNRLADLSKSLTNAQVERIGLEAQLKIIRARNYPALPGVAQDLTIQTLHKELNDLEAQDAALSSQFKPDYPPLAKLESQIHETQSQLNAEMSKVIAGIQSSYAEAAEKEDELQTEINRQRTETLNLNDSAAQYAILQREVDTNRELYNAVLTRMKDVAVTSGGEPTNLSVIVPAEEPSIPASPKPAREILLALILGLSGGIGLAFALDILDSTLKNPEEAESYLQVPSLGLVPDFTQGEGRRISYGMPAYIAGPPPEAVAGRELVTALGSYSTIGECYRNFRTALLLSRAEHPPRTMLITSATSREGKTVTSVNTAVMLAQLGGRSVLVDADLRRARCHRVLSLENEWGLTEVLTGSRSLDEAVQPSGIEHLDFLSSGAVPPNPTELLGSRRIAEILLQLGRDYDHVVIDSSPVLPVSDSLLLAKLVDGVVLVANASATPRQQVRTACARVEYAHGKILGVVLNKVKLYHPDYYPYYHGGYYYTIQDSAGSGRRQ